MDNLNLIHEFVDGTLDASMESELFTLLSGSEELRTELKQQMAIKTAVRSDINAYAPAPESTAAVFAALGMSTAAAAAASVPLTTKLMSVFSRYQQGLLGGLITAAALISFFMIKDLPSEETNAVKSDITGNGMNNSIPVVINYSNDGYDTKSASIVEKETLPRVIYRDRIVYVEKESATDEKQQSNNYVLNFSSGFAKNPFDYENIEQKSHVPARFLLPDNINKPIFPQNSITSNTEAGQLGFTFEIKGIEPFSENYQLRSAAEVQSFNNLNIALYYKLFDKLNLNALKDVELGLEWRRENIYQSFIYYDEIGKQFFKVEQQPNLNSVSLALRWLPSFLTWNDLQPYAQIMYGGNKIGTLYRGALGFEYAINESFSFNANLEYSGFNYYHILNYGNIKQNLSTNSYGLNYGISVKF